MRLTPTNILIISSYTGKVIIIVKWLSLDMECADVGVSSGLSGGAIAGIVIGVVAVIAIAVLIAFYAWRRLKRKVVLQAWHISAKKAISIYWIHQRHPCRSMSLLYACSFLHSFMVAESGWSDPLMSQSLQCWATLANFSVCAKVWQFTCSECHCEAGRREWKQVVRATAVRCLLEQWWQRWACFSIYRL